MIIIQGVIVVFKEKSLDCLNHLYMKDKNIFISQFRLFINYFLLTSVVCLIAWLLKEFKYIIIFDITFIILKIHYRNYFFHAIVKYYWIYIVIFTLIPKILLSIHINQIMIIILSLLTVILFIKEVNIENEQKNLEIQKSMNYRKNLIVFMIFIVIFVMSANDIKIAQIMTFALNISFLDFVVMKYMVNDKNKQEK